MKFTEWMKIKEMSLAPKTMGQPPPARQPNSMKIAKKDNTVDNVRSILLKSKNPKNSTKQISQIYDNEISKSTDPGEMAKMAKKKNDTLSALQDT